MHLQGFGYTFPFPIVCADDVERWPTVTRKIDGFIVEVYPPFLSGTNVRITKDFEVNASPSFKRRGIMIAGHHSPLSGFRTIPQCFRQDENFQPPQLETNAFQIEVQTRSQREAGRIEEWLMRSGLRNLKRVSSQFWIEHPAIYFEGFKRIQYKVEAGKLDHSMWSTSSVYSGTVRMCVITFEKWKSAWLTAKRDYDTDQIDSLLLSEHQLAGGFLFDAAMSCALALEKCKYLLWEKLFEGQLCTRSEFRAAINDTHKPERYFSEMLPKHCILPTQSEEQLHVLSCVWVARGLIAHGKETQLSKALGRPLDNETISIWTNCLWGLSREINAL